MNRHNDPNPFDEEEVNPFSVSLSSLSFFFFSILTLSDLPSFSALNFGFIFLFIFSFEVFQWRF